jgi:hypothetical protein
MVNLVNRIHGAVDSRRGWFTVGQGWRGHEAQRRFTGAWRTGHCRLRSLPVEAGEGEGDELVLMRGSPWHGRRQRGGTAMVEDSGGELHIARALESGR